MLASCAAPSLWRVVVAATLCNGTYNVTTYFLPRWIHFCFASDGAVFLDVKHDRYVGLDLARTRLLRRLIEEGCAAPELDEFGKELADAGLLTTTCDGNARALATTSLPEPDNLLADAFDEYPSISFAHVATFLVSCSTVWLSLHLRSFGYAVLRLKSRKGRLAKRVRRPASDLKNLVQAFVYLRTFVYTAHEHCLYDSLVLSDFLLRFGLLPTCVFGVRTLPFGAHCWVQADRSLLTESSIEFVSTFSPVLVI